LPGGPDPPFTPASNKASFFLGFDRRDKGQHGRQDSTVIRLFSRDGIFFNTGERNEKRARIRNPFPKKNSYVASQLQR
jgi:hypothetical protein